ncbi:MAG: arginase family protein, partial [Chlamydiia bacterium]|nr:arginase family protein [Chlamydiia bacterium]
MAFHSRYKEALSLSGRVDREPNATRLHQVIQRVDARQGLDACEAGGYALIGFSCDEGVRRNHGRVGAAEGPDALRRCLAGLPYAGQRPVYDLGSVICAGEDLEGAQAALGELVAAARAARLLPIVLGGGHETAWGHYLGLRPGSDSIGMLNFDAHFDLRELGEEGGTSGTPFLQIANDCHERHRPFQYCCIGIQHMGNTQALFQRAEVLKTEVILADEIILQGSPALYPRIDRF